MKFELISALTLSILMTSTVTAEVNASGKIFPRHEKLSQLYSGGTFTEGVAVAPTGEVIFADVIPTAKAGDALGRTLVYNPKTQKTRVFLSPNGQVNGHKFDRYGDLLMVSRAGFGTRSLIKLNMQNKEATLLAARFNGKPFNGLNDLAVAANGTIFITDPRYLGDEERGQPVYGVYAVDQNLNVSLVTGDVKKPNGVAISPDGKTLYVAEHFIASDNLLTANLPLQYGPMRVLAFEIEGNKTIGQATVIKDYGNNDGPDGMITDAAGNLYVAARAEPNFGIEVYNPEYQLIDFIATPEKPTNMAFARGAWKNTLYITAGGALYSVKTHSKGWF